MNTLSPEGRASRMENIKAEIAFDDAVAHSNLTQDEVDALQNRQPKRENMSEIGQEYAQKLDEATQRELGGAATGPLGPVEQMRLDDYASGDRVTQEMADKYEAQLRKSVH